MIRHPLGLRLAPDRSIRDQILEAARMGARGVVFDAIGELAPHRLGETGRRDLRRLLQTAELSLVALGLPVRRAFDTTDQLDERVRRADQAFAMAYELGTNLVLAQVGPVPPQEESSRRDLFTMAVRTLGSRADHRGVRLAVEAANQPGEHLRALLDSLDMIGLAASIDPSSLIRAGIDPISTTRELAQWVAHAYAPDGSGRPLGSPQPHRIGFVPGVLDWEEYLGALEEISYCGFLTVWPDPADDPRAQFTALQLRLERLSRACD
ncbi:MAG: sugar phosphate isomerase/epimerase family protein [Isosphaeraceae bacterium]